MRTDLSLCSHSETDCTVAWQMISENFWSDSNSTLQVYKWSAVQIPSCHSSFIYFWTADVTKRLSTLKKKFPSTQKCCMTLLFHSKLMTYSQRQNLPLSHSYAPKLLETPVIGTYINFQSLRHNSPHSSLQKASAYSLSCSKDCMFPATQKLCNLNLRTDDQTKLSEIKNWFKNGCACHTVP